MEFRSRRLLKVHVEINDGMAISFAIADGMGRPSAHTRHDLNASGYIGDSVTVEQVRDALAAFVEGLAREEQEAA